MDGLPFLSWQDTWKRVQVEFRKNGLLKAGNVHIGKQRLTKLGESASVIVLVLDVATKSTAILLIGSVLAGCVGFVWHGRLLSLCALGNSAELDHPISAVSVTVVGLGHPIRVIVCPQRCSRNLSICSGATGGLYAGCSGLWNEP